MPDRARALGADLTGSSSRLSRPTAASAAKKGRKPTVDANDRAAGQRQLAAAVGRQLAPPLAALPPRRQTAFAIEMSDTVREMEDRYMQPQAALMISQGEELRGSKCPWIKGSRGSKSRPMARMAVPARSLPDMYMAPPEETQSKTELDDEELEALLEGSLSLPATANKHKPPAQTDP